MNSNLPKSLQNKSSKLSSVSNFANDTSSNPNISPLNRVSILKTEEQKEIVRTNVFEPNDSKSGNNQQFTVVTEVIRRSSNISYEPQNNSFNKNSFEFSFNQSNPEIQINQSFPNQIIDLNKSESDSNINKINSELIISSKNNLKNDENYQNKYKLLIKRIAMQLKKKVREPTQGFFHFAFQKGDYPLMIIRKIETQIINHNIEFSNDIFRIYTQKYKKYRELIKRIAHLLKISMKNSRFWENKKYENTTQTNIQINQINQINDNKTESIQVKISKKGTNLNTGVNMNNNNNNNNNNLDGNINGDIATKVNYTNVDISISKKTNPKNKKGINNNVKNGPNDKRKNSIDNTHNSTSGNILFNQKKIKSHSSKPNIFKNSLNYHSNLSQTQNSNNVSHKMGNFINPFKITKDQKKINFSKKIENKPIFNNKTNKEKSKLTNVKSTEVTINSDTNKNEKIINVNVSKKIEINNTNTNTNSQMMDIEMQNNDANKMDIIKEENTTIQYDNNLSNNMNDKNSNFVNTFTFSNDNVDIVNNNNFGNTLNLVGSESEPIMRYSESNDNEKKNDFNRINSDIIQDKKVEIFGEKNSIFQTSTSNNANNAIYNMNTIQNSNINIDNNNILNSNINVPQNNFLNHNNMNIISESHNETISNNSTGTFGKFMNSGNDINNINNININNNSNVNSEYINTITNSNINSTNIISNMNSFNNHNIIINNNLEKKTNNINIDLKKPNSEGVNSKNVIMNISPIRRSTNVQDNNNNQEIITDNSLPINTNNKNKKRISINYAKNTGQKIEIKFSSIKKSQLSEGSGKKSSKSKDTNKEINMDNIESKGNDINISEQDIDSIMEQKWEMNTAEEKASLARKFNLFLSKNNIMVQFNIPTSIDEKGKDFLRKNIFWEKYIQYIYINYLVNNVKFSLFSFIQVIEQYFIWCEDINAEEIKKLIIQTIDKIYDQKEIGQFLTMNKIDNLEELFKKYQIFMNIEKKNTNNIYKFGKEIEIKINNQEKCNCELCKSELACMKKMSEVNKNLITGVKIEDIFYNGNNKTKSDNTNLSTDQYQISYEAKEKNKNNFKFTESKTKHTFELVYNYIPQSYNDNDNQVIEVEEKESKESNKNSKKKEKSKDKSLKKNKKKQNKSKKDSDSENYIDVPKDNKIYYYFDKEIDTKENSDEPKEEENNKKDNNKRKKSVKKENKSKRNSMNKYYIVDEDDDDDNDDNYNKNKKNKNGKAKKRNSIKIKDTESGSEYEEEPRKKSRKKEKSKPKNKYKIQDSDSESENDSRNSSKKKKKIQYPKVNKKKRGKNN